MAAAVGIVEKIISIIPNTILIILAIKNNKNWKKRIVLLNITLMTLLKVLEYPIKYIAIYIQYVAISPNTINCLVKPNEFQWFVK